MSDSPDPARDLELFKAQLAADLQKHKAELDQAGTQYRAECERQLAHWQATNEGQLAHWKATIEQSLQTDMAMFRGVVDFALIALRGIVLANGGAAVALLAFMGHILGRSDPATRAGVSPLADALGLFTFGVGSGIASAGLAYMAQVVFLESRNKEGAQRVWPGAILRVLAVIAALVGVGLFFAGVVSALDAFQQVSAIGPLNSP